MEHGGAGAVWGDAGIQVKCMCGWLSTPPTQMGYGWIEDLTAKLNAHLADPENA